MISRNRIVLFIGLLIFSVTAFSRDGATIIFAECPPGFTNAEPNLCIQDQWTGEKGKFYHISDRRQTQNKTFFEAQSECRSIGAHLCTQAELYASWDLISSDLDHRDMIGDFVLDDHHLCVNNPRDRNNFEGYCHKHYKYRYRCCMSFGPMPGFPPPF